MARVLCFLCVANRYPVVLPQIIPSGRTRFTESSSHFGICVNSAFCCKASKIAVLLGTRFTRGCTPANALSEAQSCVQDYVRSRILDFAGGQAFAKRLYTSANTVRAAAQDALQELSQPWETSANKNLKLVFRHTCL